MILSMLLVPRLSAWRGNRNASAASVEARLRGREYALRIYKLPRRRPDEPLCRGRRTVRLWG